jgi:predicted SAM-dependent methyltransferase
MIAKVIRKELQHTMKSQRLKDIYFFGTRPILKVNAWRWYIHKQLKPSASVRKVYLNMGCGDKYLEGFINIDGNVFRKKDMWLDLRNGLPFSSHSVDAIYSCHVFEHFYISELKVILKECWRLLKPTGGIRILVPSLEEAISAYIAGRRDWFPDFPSSFSSLGGRFFNYIFCDSQHRLTFDFSFLDELLRETSFRNSVRTEPGKSDLFPSDILDKIEHANEGYIQTSLIVEARPNL